MQATDTSSQRRKKSHREFTIDTPRDVLVDTLIEKEYKIRRMQELFADALQLLQDTERRTAEAEARILDTAKGLERLKQCRVNPLDDTRNMKQDNIEAQWWATHGQDALAEKTNSLSHLLDDAGYGIDEATRAHLIRDQHAEALATARGVDGLWSRATPQSKPQQTTTVADPVSVPSNPDENTHHITSGNIRSRPPYTPATSSTYSEYSQETPHPSLTDIRPRANRPYRMHRAHSVSGATCPPDAIRDSLRHVENSCATSQTPNTTLKSLLSESKVLPSDIIDSSSRKRRLSLTERMLDISKAIFCPSSTVAGIPADPWRPTEHTAAVHFKPRPPRRYSVDSDKSLPPPVPPKDYPSTRKERLLLADDLRYGAAAKEIFNYRESITENKERDTSAYLGPDRVHREAAAMFAYPDRRDSRSPRTSLLSTTATPTVADAHSRRSSHVASSTLAGSTSSDGEPHATSSAAARVGLSPPKVPSIMVTPPSRTTSIEDLPSASLSRKRHGRSSSGAPLVMKLSPDNQASKSPKHLIGSPSNPPASLLLSPDTCRTPRARRSSSRATRTHRQKDTENRSSQLTGTAVCGEVHQESPSNGKRSPVNRGYKVKKPMTRPLPIPPPTDVSSTTARPSHYEGPPNNTGNVSTPKKPLLHKFPQIAPDAKIILSSEIKTLRRVKRQVLRV
ncbi:hypothetical protein IW261DRAFT_1569366 [Armillaria novae-zelandiae]|uniref:Uncharacterized protein n=1 Tax=Armillaria novae-zelandiae TaxID=153914 RepID=A0AA39U9A5_9AGAR|nr:hypothetical protein IW261DRAFT_1569366 [Armillaria novae-zelandiae]